MPEDNWVAASLKSAMGGYTDEQLTEAFDLVANKANWKLAIDAIVPAGSNMDLIGRAVTFYAGCIADYEEMPDGTIRVTADGYYMSVGS